MIGLDTNILLCWLLLPEEGDIGSSDAEIEGVAAIIRAPGARFHVNPVVIAETAWLLEQKLRLGRADVGAVVERLLYAENVVVGSAPQVAAARLAFAASNANFADCLIAQLNLAAGCSHTLTFDRKASRTPGFRHAGDSGPTDPGASPRST